MALNATTDFIFIFILFCSSNEQSQAVAIHNELDSKLSYKAPTTVAAHELRTTDKIKTHTHDRLERGTLFRRLFVLRHHCCSSAATSRRHCFSDRTLHHSVWLYDRL